MSSMSYLDVKHGIKSVVLPCIIIHHYMPYSKLVRHRFEPCARASTCQELHDVFTSPLDTGYPDYMPIRTSAINLINQLIIVHQPSDRTTARHVHHVVLTTPAEADTCMHPHFVLPHTSHIILSTCVALPISHFTYHTDNFCNTAHITLHISYYPLLQYCPYHTSHITRRTSVPLPTSHLT